MNRLPPSLKAKEIIQKLLVDGTTVDELKGALVRLAVQVLLKEAHKVKVRDTDTRAGLLDLRHRSDLSGQCGALVIVAYGGR